MLTVKNTYFKGSYKYANCVCHCGREKSVRLDHVKSGRTKSCGCLLAESSRKRMTTHGDYGTRLYSSWANINREVKPVTKRWRKFENFKADVVEIPRGKYLHRIDDKRKWGKDNFRFCTVYELRRDRPSVKYFNWMGKDYCLQELADIAGIKKPTLRRRLLHLNWTIQDAMTTKAYQGRNETGHKLDLLPINQDAMLAEYEKFAEASGQ